MGLELGTYIQDLVSTNPVSSDEVNQGDDHLRLLKTILKANFPNATKSFYFPASSSKTASFTIASTEDNVTFVVNATSASVEATLPTLVGANAGWRCYFIRSDSTANTFHVKPASGSVSSGGISVTKARRCIPGTRFDAYWDGSNWFIERCVRSPVGSLIPFTGATLPTGYEWPSGQTLASASTNYQEYNSVIGSGLTVDARGRVIAGKDNMGGSTAGRMTGSISGIVGTTLHASGGGEHLSLTVAQLPSHNHGGVASGSGTGTGTGSGSGSGTGSGTGSGATDAQGTHSHGGITAYQSATGFGNYQHAHTGAAFYGGGASIGGFGGGGTYVGGSAVAISIDAANTDHYHVIGADGNHAHNVSVSVSVSSLSVSVTVSSVSVSVTTSSTIPSQGSDAAHSNMQPTIVENMILVVE